MIMYKILYSTRIPCQFAGGVDGVGDGHAVEAGGDANYDQQLHLDTLLVQLCSDEVSMQGSLRMRT